MTFVQIQPFVNHRLVYGEFITGHNPITDSGAFLKYCDSNIKAFEWGSVLYEPVFTDCGAVCRIVGDRIKKFEVALIRAANNYVLIGNNQLYYMPTVHFVCDGTFYMFPNITGNISTIAAAQKFIALTGRYDCYGNALPTNKLNQVDINGKTAKDIPAERLRSLFIASANKIHYADGFTVDLIPNNYTFNLNGNLKMGIFKGAHTEGGYLYEVEGNHVVVPKRYAKLLYEDTKAVQNYKKSYSYHWDHDVKLMGRICVVPPIERMYGIIDTVAVGPTQAGLTQTAQIEKLHHRDCYSYSSVGLEEFYFI